MTAIVLYDYGQLDPRIRTSNAERYTQSALEQVAANRANGVLTVNHRSLSDGQIDDLIALLHALTDPCVKSRACLSPWIPNGTAADPDGHRLIAVDAQGNEL